MHLTSTELAVYAVDAAMVLGWGHLIWNKLTRPADLLDDDDDEQGGFWVNP